MLSSLAHHIYLCVIFACLLSRHSNSNKNYNNTIHCEEKGIPTSRMTAPVDDGRRADAQCVVRSLIYLCVIFACLLSRHSNSNKNYNNTIHCEEKGIPTSRMTAPVDDGRRADAQ